MKRRVISMLLAALLLVSLGLPATAAASGSVYFTSVNDNLCPLSDDTMPFWSGGSLYVPSTVFSGYDLGVSYVRDTAAQRAYLYNRNKLLEFDMENGGVTNESGTYYSASVMTRHGYVCFPLALVCSYFGLSYSVRDTAWAPLVRVCSSSAVLSDSRFIDAATSLMDSRYSAYEQGKKTPAATKPSEPQTGSDPSTTKDPQPSQEGTDTDNRTNALIYLAVRAGDDDTTAAMLDTLSRFDYRAAFFFGPSQLAGRDDLLRRIVSGGHRIGFIQTEQNGASALEEGNDLLRRCTGTTTRMVLMETKAELPAGFTAYTATISAENLGKTASARARQIQKRIEKSRGSVKLLLGGDRTSASALAALCTQLQENGAGVRAANEVVCG